MRGATCAGYRACPLGIISIHAPRAGCDALCRRATCRRRTFQSTHPVRGATNLAKYGDFSGYISIHAPRAGCDLGVFDVVFGLVAISIHAPRAGCDAMGSGSTGVACVFQSTHPVRGATTFMPAHLLPLPHFNPRTPCGVRPGQHFEPALQLQISIHAPRAGCDRGCR